MVAYLTYLASERRVSRSTQMQALSALMLLYRDVLAIPLPDLRRVLRSTSPTHLPAVLSREEVGAVLGQKAANVLEWGLDLGLGTLGHGARTLDDGLKHVKLPFMKTHAGEVLRNGVELAVRNWKAFLERFGLTTSQIDKVICHQVGSANKEAVLKSLGIDRAKDFSTYEFLGNIGTVSLPLTAAVAEEREFLVPGDRVGWLGIGSGLNCMMLGVEW